jgi:hypothetical protein
MIPTKRLCKYRFEWPTHLKLTLDVKKVWRYRGKVRVCILRWIATADIIIYWAALVIICAITTTASSLAKNQNGIPAKAADHNIFQHTGDR